MDGQKLGLMETAERLLQKVPTEEKKLYIYAHSIFWNELASTTKIIKKLIGYHLVQYV